MENSWYLMKHDDGVVFGPVPFEQIKDWAMAAQISPLDKLSTDQVSWTKAPMYPELEMDWLLQISADHYYGPTTISAIKEFVGMGEIGGDTTMINCKDGTHFQVKDIPDFDDKVAEDESGSSDNSGREGDEALDLDNIEFISGDTSRKAKTEEPPVRISVRTNLQQRIRELELALMNERRVAQEAEERYDKLAAKYFAETGKHPE